MFKTKLDKEETEWIKNLTIVGEPSNGIRHHHYKLSDVVAGVINRLDALEETMEVIKIFIGKELYCQLRKQVKRIKNQEFRIRMEQKRLMEMKSGLKC